MQPPGEQGGRPVPGANGFWRRHVCPGCGSRDLVPSRRHTPWEEWSSLLGRSYFRCGQCNLRFSAFAGVGESGTYYAKMFELRRMATRVMLVAGVLMLVVFIAVGLDFFSHVGSTGSGTGRK